MHAAQLVELAAGLAVWPPPTEADRLDRVEDGVVRYWVACRCLIQRWTHALAQGSRGPAKRFGRKLSEVAEELFLADVLARVWSGWTRRESCPQAIRTWGAVGEGIIRSNLDVRRRVLSAMIDSTPPISKSRLYELNRIRRRAERWNDTLLAVVSDGAELEDLAFVPRRVAQLRESLGPQGRLQVSSRVVEAVRAHYYGQGLASGVNGPLNLEIAVALFWCLGAWRTANMVGGEALWPARMASTTDAVFRLVEHL